MALKPENTYCAKIGGLIYKNVAYPIMYEEEPIFKLFRDEDNNCLSVSFNIYDVDMSMIAKVTHNDIEICGGEHFQLIRGKDRICLIDSKTYRSWCDLKYNIKDQEYEIDISTIIYISKGLPIILHPDRTKLFTANDNSSPNMSRFSIVHDSRENESASISIDFMPFYLLNIGFENFQKGILITNKRQ